MVPGPQPTSSMRASRRRCGSKNAAEFSAVRDECERRTASEVAFACRSAARGRFGHLEGRVSLN